MKPRIQLAETLLPDGSPLALQEHDGRISLSIRGQQICGPSSLTLEQEAARMGCAPFRPVRQPKLWFCGLGLGNMLAAACQELPQKRGRFFVAEPLPELAAWHRQHLPGSPLLTDPRVTLEADPGPPGLAPHEGLLHAIFAHLDSCPIGPRNQPWPEDARWLDAAHRALQNGGLLVLAGSRISLRLRRFLDRAGFETAITSVPSSPQARKPRMLPVWLARKGKGGH